MPDPAPTEPDELVARRALAVDRHTASVSHLLAEREELYGVAPMADLIFDSVRWTA